MKTYFQEQWDFFEAMGSPSLKTHSREECCILSERLIYEEAVNETLPALRRYQASGSLEHLTELADGLADTVYVCLHTANSLGIPFDSIWSEVQRSNMAKIDADGKVHKRADGKILKPPGWTPPQLFIIMMEHMAREQYGDEYMQTGMVK